MSSGCINSDNNRCCAVPISVGDLIDHYIRTELSSDASWHSHATGTIYSYFLQKWIRPQWDEVSLRSVRTVAVEHWLRRLCRIDGNPMADSTKAKVRNIFSVVFNHAIRYEWLAQGKNPIALVRQSAKRQRDPVVLELKEVQAILAQLEPSARLMVMLAATHGPHGNSREVARSARPHLEAYLLTAGPATFPPETLLGPFHARCQREYGRPSQILDHHKIDELFDLKEYSNRYHHDTNQAWETEALNDGELLGYIGRLLAFTRP